MALPSNDCPSFQEAEAVAGSGNELCQVDFRQAALPFKSTTLPISEKPFIAQRKAPAIRCYVRLAIYATVSLFYAACAGASDDASPAISKTTERTSNSTSSTSQTLSGDQEKIENAGKYDIDRIGQRSVGKGVNLYSLEKERALGRSMADSIDLHTRFVLDPDINDYINRLAQKIARNSDAQVPFTIKVIDCLDLRTFALPGGFLYVDKGLIMEVDSEAELAGLMAREIAHVAARHATRYATRKYAWNMISLPLAYLGPASLGTRQIGPLALKKFSRDAESEADLLGIEYQYAAGYDPQAFVDALEKLHATELQMRNRMSTAPRKGASVPLHQQIARAFATYPPTEERIQKAQTEISTLLPNRNDYVMDTNEFQEVKAKLLGADRPILRRHRPGDSMANAPLLHRRPPEPQQQLAPYQRGYSLAEVEPVAR